MPPKINQSGNTNQDNNNNDNTNTSPSNKSEVGTSSNTNMTTSNAPSISTSSISSSSSSGSTMTGGNSGVKANTATVIGQELERRLMNMVPKLHKLAAALKAQMPAAVLKRIQTGQVTSYDFMLANILEVVDTADWGDSTEDQMANLAGVAAIVASYPNYEAARVAGAMFPVRKNQTAEWRELTLTQINSSLNIASPSGNTSVVTPDIERGQITWTFLQSLGYYPFTKALGSKADFVTQYAHQNHALSANIVSVSAVYLPLKNASCLSMAYALIKFTWRQRERFEERNSGRTAQNRGGRRRNWITQLRKHQRLDDKVSFSEILRSTPLSDILAVDATELISNDPNNLERLRKLEQLANRIGQGHFQTFEDVTKDMEKQGL